MPPRTPPTLPVRLALTALYYLVGGIPHGSHAEGQEATLQTPQPERWLPSTGDGCHHKGGYKSRCDGPRRAPEPHGPAANLAETLGLGTRRAANRLLGRGPLSDWVRALGSEASRNLLWPVPDGRFGRGFGYTRKRRKHLLHKGLDIVAKEGAYFRAVNDGLVGYSDNGIRGYGNTVLLIHADASVSLYAHNRANYVFAGQRVRRGQVLGEVGQTGIAWGPHVHFEWRKGGRPRDPMKRMVEAPSRHRDRSRRTDRASTLLL